MHQRSVSSVFVAGVVLAFGVLTGAAGAQDDGLVPDDVELQIAALAAIDVDPWEPQDDEIDERREPVAEYGRVTKAAAPDTAAARAESERELEAAEAVHDAAREHRADMEEEVEGYSIEMWLLGDLGLQEMYGSDAERARQEQPVIAVTESLIARVEEADAAIAAAEADVEVAAIALGERAAADDVAQRIHRHATQIHDRLETMIAARNDRIDRLTHELLEVERPEVELVTITSVTVNVPIGLPDDRGAAATGDGVQEASVPAGQTGDGSDVPAEAIPVPTTPTTVAIAPIMVNAEIAGQVQALIGAARSDGIDLHGAGFRPVEDQITLRIAHCGTSGFDIFDRPAGECSPPTARPGSSEHELGLAIDFTENGSILTPGSAGFTWMVANAGSYGLINLPSEAWHWSTTGG